MATDEWLKVPAVAARIGMSDSHVRLLIKTGRLAASREGARGNYRVRASECARYLAELESAPEPALQVA